MRESDSEGFQPEGITLAAPVARFEIPPSYVDDVRKLLDLEQGGFLPVGRVGVTFSRERECYVATVSGGGVGYLLDLLLAAADLRDAETWNEVRERKRDQLALFGRGEG